MALQQHDYWDAFYRSRRSADVPESPSDFENVLNAQFSVLDLYDREAALQIGNEHAQRENTQVIYARFLIHSLEATGRQNLLPLAAAAPATSGSLFLEFRTGLDQNASHLFGDDHYRNYVDPDVVVREIENHGGRIVDLVQGHGMAIYKSEDPHVARIWAAWGESR